MYAAAEEDFFDAIIIDIDDRTGGKWQRLHLVVCRNEVDGLLIESRDANAVGADVVVDRTIAGSEPVDPAYQQDCNQYNKKGDGF